MENKTRIEQLFDQMLNEAPVMFTPKMKPYIIEFAKIYAKEVAEKSLEEASRTVSYKLKDNIHDLSMMDDWNEIDKESITNPKNIILDL